jgi:hypothetical protein
VIEVLARYLAKALAETTERHGALWMGFGWVLITRRIGRGQSELGLELIEPTTAWSQTTWWKSRASRRIPSKGAARRC